MAQKPQKADILEIFSSVQGEGPFAGIKQVFVKFAKCNLKCRFCDIEGRFPPKDFSSDKLLSIIKQVCQNSGGHHSVSLTGGEPLLYKDFLKEFLPRLKGAHGELKVYLETNSTLPASLKNIINHVDIVAMDFKLPSATGQRGLWDKHEKFLRIARRKNCFIKAVITDDTKETDIKRAVDIIHTVDKDILLVLQPVWPVKDLKRAKTSLLFEHLFLAEKKLNNVRIMPQMHKILRAK